MLPGERRIAIQSPGGDLPGRIGRAMEVVAWATGGGDRYVCWSELNEDHPVAVSHHDATPASCNIEHRISGRNSSLGL